ncbi:D-alanyl-D-alanine carboxypeptidase family protein [Microbacterium sp. cx-59]|uniref:D-alanyl-D-alanine carboxypeptidase family protein n=1 Tax=Microbacterium sp. cx-59 TaxID=2891207 RepID=UPI001E594091|nr:D-alanyl-D-alanine carboxypeptidase [Microbacterium sp. cx-59]MCC4909074.1 D-alanyl-D-alanine carboxypeptidase [Microbacterium sp. cx-59]
MTTQDRTSDGFSDLAQWMDAEADPAAESPEDARRRRRRRRTVWIVALVLVAIVVGVPGGYVAWALNAPLPPPTGSAQAPALPVGTAVTLALPSDGASAISVSGAEAYLGPDASGIWAASGTDEARPIGSISKLITALVVLNAKPLASAEDPGPTLTFDEADNDLYDKYYVMGATIAAMPTGSAMSQHDALATMLLPSASNYAEAVSTWAFGSQSAFVSATRRWLAENGMTGTTIVEPTGINPRNTSTKTDLLTLGRLAAAQPVIAQLAATNSLTVPGAGVLHNTNDLLGESGITGLKTGNLGENSYNLLYTATLDAGPAGPLSVTGVSLGGFSHDSVNAGVLALLASIRGGFHDVAVATAGQRIGTVRTEWGATAAIVIDEDRSLYTWSDTPITVSLRIPALDAPGAAGPVLIAPEDGAVIGTITWTAGPNTVESDVRIEGTIEQPSEWWRLTHPGQLGNG